MRKTLKEVPNDKINKAIMLLNVFEKEFGISKEDILSTKRKGKRPIHRAMCFNILRKVEKLEMWMIGAIFSKDHSTAIHGVKVHKDMYQTNAPYREKYDNLIAKYLYHRDVHSLNNEEEDSMVRFMNDIQSEINNLSKIKEALILKILIQKPIGSEELELINKLFSENDKRAIIEEIDSVKV